MNLWSQYLFQYLLPQPLVTSSTICVTHPGLLVAIHITRKTLVISGSLKGSENPFRVNQCICKLFWPDYLKPIPLHSGWINYPVITYHFFKLTTTIDLINLTESLRLTRNPPASTSVSLDLATFQTCWKKEIWQQIYEYFGQSI